MSWCYLLETALPAHQTSSSFDTANTEDSIHSKAGKGMIFMTVSVLVIVVAICWHPGTDISLHTVPQFPCVTIFGKTQLNQILDIMVNQNLGLGSGNYLNLISY